jgi:transposase
LQLEVAMDVLHARCAGLDVHRDSVVACARLVTADGTAYEIATFGTMAADLERLATWLLARDVTEVARRPASIGSRSGRRLPPRSS